MAAEQWCFDLNALIFSSHWDLLCISGWLLHCWHLHWLLFLLHIIVLKIHASSSFQHWHSGLFTFRRASEKMYNIKKSVSFFRLRPKPMLIFQIFMSSYQAVSQQLIFFVCIVRLAFECVLLLRHQSPLTYFVYIFLNPPTNLWGADSWIIPTYNYNQYSYWTEFGHYQGQFSA